MKEELLIVIFLLLGPILDVLAFYGIEINIIFRGLFLLYVIYSLIRKKKDKKFIYLILLFSLGQFVFQKFYLNYSIISSVSSIFRFIYLPCSILYFKNLSFKKYNRNKIILFILITYIIIFLLSYITRIGASAYLDKDGKTGFKGLFSSINEFSAIVIGLLLPAIIYLKKKKNYLLIGLLLLGSILCSLLSGTKVLFGGILLVIGYLLFSERKKIINKYGKKKVIIIIILLIGIFILAFFKTRVYNNMLIQQSFFKARRIISYEFLNYVLFNDRLTFLISNFNVYKVSNILNIIFGLGYNYINVKMVEIDIFDILFRYGLIGFIIFVLTFIKINYKNLEKYEIFTILLLLLISLTSGHVLIYPNVCIYIALINSKKKT